MYLLHTYPLAQMLIANPNVESYRVDEGMPIFHTSYKNSESDLEKFLDELRRDNSGIANLPGTVPLQ